ncbi:MAG TPA: hypothetical protein VI957_03200 [Candidatus Paceibacterota bacterium]
MIPEKNVFSRAVVFCPHIKPFELQKGFHSAWGTSQAPHGRHLMSAMGGGFFQEVLRAVYGFFHPATYSKKML